MKYSKAVCPVEDFDRTWIDQSLIWFEQKLGKDFIRNREYLIPVNCKFKYQYFNSQEAIQYFIEFICAYIELDASLIQFQLFWNEIDDGFPEGLDVKPEEEHYIQEYTLNDDGRYEIGIDEDGLNDFDGTFMSLVYKLTYVKMLQKNVFTFENVYMINYVMVLLGFGVLMANSFVRTHQWRGLRYSAWEVKRIGLLNHRVYGYLFAVLSKYRGESDNALWQKYFCSDVQKFYLQACKYVEELKENENLPAPPVPVKDEDVFIEKYFYANGSIRLIAHAIDGKFEGLATFFYQNGFLWSERVYKNNIPFTVLSNYNPYDEEVEKGTLFQGNGTLYIYNPDGNLNRIEEYLNGARIK